MARRTIARLGEPIVRQRAVEVDRRSLDTPALAHLIEDMIDTMRAENGVGLAAPQIRESVRIVVIEANKNPRYPQFPSIPLRVLINPIVTPASGSSTLPPRDSISIYEGCLSVPGMRGRVVRPRSVRVQALDAEGKTIDEQWEGIAAAIIQHETDHLDGTLFVDRADPRTFCFSEEYEQYVPAALRVVDGSEEDTPRTEDA